MAEVNIPLLRKAVEWAEAEAMKPEIDCMWDQTEFIRPADERAERLLWGTSHEEEPQAVALVAAQCGTAYCIAGYVGATLDKRFERGHSDAVLGHVERYAAEALGLTPDKASRLFEGDNTIADIRRIAEDLAGERL